MPPVFTAQRAARLDGLSLLQVREAAAGDVIGPGQAWVAPGDHHMVVSRSGSQCVLGINQSLPENSCRPAADVLFRPQGTEGVARDDMRSLIETRRMNLADLWSQVPRMDVAFLRNVLIYFEPETRRDILRRVHGVLRPDGHLFFWGTENTLDAPDLFERLQVDRQYISPPHGPATKNKSTDGCVPGADVLDSLPMYPSDPLYRGLGRALLAVALAATLAGPVLSDPAPLPAAGSASSIAMPVPAAPTASPSPTLVTSPSSTPPAAVSSPLTLRQCVTLGLDAAPRIKRQAAEAREKDARTREILAARDTKISGSASLQYNQPEVFATFPLPRVDIQTQAVIQPYIQYNFTFTLTQLISNFGLLDSQAALNALKADATRLDLMLSRRDLTAAIADAYLEVVRCGRLRRLADETLKQRLEHRARAVAQYKHGKVARYDVMQADVEIAVAQDQQVAARRALDTAIATLRSQLCLAYDQAVDIAGDDAEATLLPPQVLPPDLAAARELGLRRRVEILVTTNLLRQGEKALDVARASNNPTLSAGVSYAQKTATFLFPNWGVQVGLQLNVPIITGGDRPARVAQARELIRQAGFARDEQVQRISLEVEQAWLALREAAERRQTVVVRVARAEEGVRVARLRYEEGLSTGLEQIDAQTALDTARVNETNVMIDYLEAAVSLERAMGTLEDGGLPARP